MQYNLYFSLMRYYDFSTFICDFHLFNYLFLGECNIFFFFKAIFIKKIGRAIWDAMLVSKSEQSQIAASAPCRAVYKSPAVKNALV